MDIASTKVEGMVEGCSAEGLVRSYLAIEEPGGSSMEMNSVVMVAGGN
jgi:hypothetical protein